MPSDTGLPSAPETTPPTILLVESDGLVRAALAEYLRHCGYRVLEAQSAAEAVVLLEAGANGIELVFTDAELAGAENGFALATRVRQHWPHIQVLLTGGVANATQKAGEICATGPMLTKPYGDELVLARIQQLLREAGGRRNGELR